MAQKSTKKKRMAYTHHHFLFNMDLPSDDILTVMAWDLLFFAGLLLINARKERVHS